MQNHANAKKTLANAPQGAWRAFYAAGAAAFSALASPFQPDNLMLALKDKTTGKFLKHFSCSFNEFQRKQGGWRFKEKHGRNATSEEVRAACFCLPTADGAKLYVGLGGVKTAHGRHERGSDGKGWTPIPLEISHPWMEIVQVQTTGVYTEPKPK